MAQAKDKTADDNGEGHIPFIEQFVKIELWRQLIERDVPKHDEQNSDDAEGER